MARRRIARKRRGRRRGIRRGRGVVRRGGMIRGRMHPPSNSASPWNNYVVTFLWNPSTDPFVAKQDLSLDSVRKAVKDELGLGTAAIDMKIRRIDVWTQPQSANSTRNTVVLAPYDWTNCDGKINWYEAWGTATQPAHCHYVWPTSISNIVLVNSKTCSVACLDVRDKAFAYIIKVHLMWRPADPTPLKMVHGIVTSLRTPTMISPPSDYVIVGDAPAISPLANVVDALSLRT